MYVFPFSSHANSTNSEKGEFMKAIIMAGGKGTRLKPLTDNLPKPLVKLIDRPVMEYTINLLKRHGITEIGVTLGYRAEDIVSYFGSGSRFGVELTYFKESVPLGTAGGIKNASSFLDEDFLVLSGDAYTELDISEAIRFHYHKKSPLTVVATPCENPAGFGVLETDYDGKIVRFEEKPLNPRPSLINCGIYVISKKVLNSIPDGFYDFGKQLLPSMAGKIYAYVTYDYWTDIGTLPSYYGTCLKLSQNYAQT